MNFRDTTRQLIRLLEEKSGYPVEVLEDPKMTTIASIRIARDNLPAHILTYKPMPGAAPDYAICWQCAFALRLFECPPEQRVLISGTEAGEDFVDDLVVNGAGRKLRLDRVQMISLRQQLYMGLITHLRSVPVGLRVVTWMGRNYPQLHSLERTFAEEELKLGEASLDTRVQEMMPPEIFNPTSAISAAHAIYWSQRLEKPELVNPYRLMGFESQGHRLLEALDSLDAAPQHDRSLIDRWAALLGLQDWYTWTPYIAP